MLIRRERPARGLAIITILALIDSSALAATPAHEILAAPESATLWSFSALADGQVQLRWQVSDDRCPGADELALRIDNLLAGAALDLQATAHVQPPRPGADARWRLDLQLRWARGSDNRTLHANNCTDLADATVILVAVLAAPLAMTRNFVPSVPPLPPAP